MIGRHQNFPEFQNEQFQNVLYACFIWKRCLAYDHARPLPPALACTVGGGLEKGRPRQV